MASRRRPMRSWTCSAARTSGRCWSGSEPVGLVPAEDMADDRRHGPRGVDEIDPDSDVAQPRAAIGGERVDAAPRLVDVADDLARLALEFDRLTAAGPAADDDFARPAGAIRFRPHRTVERRGLLG